MLELFRRMVLGSGDSGTPPSVNFLWGLPSSGIDDKVCQQPVCSYQIYNYVTDPDNDVKNILIQVSTDFGATWSTLIANLDINNHIINESISLGNKWYRAIITDHEGNETISRTLKITKQLPALGNINIVYNNVNYSKNNTNPILMLIGNPTPFAFKNRHASEYVECYSPIINNAANAMDVFKTGQPEVKPTILVSPQNGQSILPGSSLPASIDSIGHEGLYTVTLSQVTGQVNGNNTYDTFSWNVRLIDNITPINKGFKARHPEGHAGQDAVVYIDLFGNEQTQVLQRAGWFPDPSNPGQDMWVEAPCTPINYLKIIDDIGAMGCTYEE